MFIIGYFESSLVNAVSTGYGVFKIDLLSFFDPKLDGQDVSWSRIFTDLPGTHFEGFTFIGFANICLIFFSLILFLIKKYYLKNYQNYFTIFSWTNLSLIIFFFWAITTNISFLGNQIFTVELPKYLFALLSIFSSTGRFAWPVIYAVIFFSLIIIYRNLNIKISILLILVLLTIHISDISQGVKAYSLNNLNKNQKNEKDKIWDVINKDFNSLRTTYLFNNYGPIFSNISKILAVKNIKTDIILNASMDRIKTAEMRYKFIQNVIDNDFENKTAYIVDNLGHLKQLKLKFSNDKHGFFYRDNFWIFLPKKKILMNNKDLNELKKVKLDNIELNKEYKLKFKDKFQGLGWSHNFDRDGIWSEGKNSFLLFELPDNIQSNYSLQLSFLPYMKNNNENYKVKFFINNKFIKNIKISENTFVELPFSKRKDSNEVIIQLQFQELLSPFDVLESPDGRKLGILLKSIKLSKI